METIFLIMQVYIIRDTYEISEFTAETFLKVYDRDGKGKNTELRFIDSDFDLPEITDDMVILGEDPEANGFQDVTEFVKTRQVQPGLWKLRRRLDR